jgi:signal transduction histidine kinase
MPLGTSAYTLLGLTALVAALVSILVFALLRFMTAAREVHGRSRQDDLLSGVLEEAVARLKAQERAASARAEGIELEEQRRLEESVDAALELTAGLAGEWERRLAVIQQSCQSIDLAALPEPNREHVERIRTEAASLRRSSKALLDDDDLVSHTRTRVDLRLLCERAVLAVRAEARVRGGDAAIHGEFGVIDGDELQLQRGFSTLVRHALDACARASAAPALAVSSTLDRSAGVQCVSIDDNCSDNRRAQLFKSFPETERTTSALEVARALKTVLAHQGRVSIKTRAGEGTRIEITWPLPK